MALQPGTAVLVHGVVTRCGSVFCYDTQSERYALQFATGGFDACPAALVEPLRPGDPLIAAAENLVAARALSAQSQAALRRFEEATSLDELQQGLGKRAARDDFDPELAKQAHGDLNALARARRALYAAIEARVTQRLRVQRLTAGA